MINETRAAEAGGHIIDDTSEHVFSPKRVIALKALEDTTFTTIVAANPEVTGLSAYYNSEAHTLYRGETIDANIASLELASGSVQVYYQA
jgi:hypothetical protein